MNFSERLKKFRIEKGYTQYRLANALNVSQNAVYNWENGKREPSLDMIDKIARTLNISPQNLLTSGSIESKIEFDTDHEASVYLDILANIEKMNINGMEETKRFTSYLVTNSEYTK